MMIPGLDLIRLFIIRIVKGKNPFLADSNHIHHLYLKKFSLNTTFLIIQFQIIFPIILFYIFNVNLLFLILLSSSIYLLIVLYFTYLKKI